MRQCRICLESGGTLISPCLCNGTSKYVHYECLEQWRNTTDNEQAKIKCMECNAKYVIVNKYKKEIMFIDIEKNFVLKHHILQFFLGLVVVFCSLAIDYSVDKPSLKFLNYIYPSNITTIVQENTVNILLYYNLYGFSLLYFFVFLFFTTVQLAFIYQKLRYFKKTGLILFTSLIISCSYIYYYLIFLFNQYLYLYFGLSVPLVNIVLFHVLVTKHNDTIKDLNKKNVNIYLQYPDNYELLERNNANITIQEIDSEPDTPLLSPSPRVFFPPPSPPEHRRNLTYLNNPLINTSLNIEETNRENNRNNEDRLSVYPPISDDFFDNNEEYQESQESNNNENQGFVGLMDELLNRSKNNTINLRKTQRTHINLKDNDKLENTSNFNAVIQEFKTKSQRQKKN